MIGKAKQLAWAVAGLCILPAGPVRADEAAARTITVTGSADVRVVPDEIVIRFSVETNRPTVKEAKADNDERVKRALDVVRGEGIEEKHIQTDYVNIGPWYDYSGSRQKQLGYTASKSVEVVLRDVAKFEALVEKLIAAGVNEINSIDFRTTELRKHKDAARRLAVTAAREKAADMAAVLGERIGRPLRIEEQASSGWHYAGAGWFAKGAAPSMLNQVVEASGEGVDLATMALGQITVNAQVTVSFELQDQAGQ